MMLLRFTGIALLLVIVGTGMLYSRISWGKELPSLEAPVVYMGEYREKETTLYTVLLYLGESQEFVLYEDVYLPNGKISSWEITGKWYQIQANSLLQLTNKNSFYRIMNVGSSGDLYCGIPLQVNKNITITLREKKREPPEYTIFGSIHSTSQGIFLKDSEIDKLRTVIEEKTIQEFIKDHPVEKQKSLFVEVRVSVVQKKKSPSTVSALSIKDITLIHEVKKSESYSTRQYFLDSVVAHRWVLKKIENDVSLSPLFLSFRPDAKKNNGTWELFDGIRHVTGSYTLHDQGISLSGDVREAHLHTLIRRTRSWQLVGEVLELWDEKQILALLEKVH